MATQSYIREAIYLGFYNIWCIINKSELSFFNVRLQLLVDSCWLVNNYCGKFPFLCLMLTCDSIAIGFLLRFLPFHVIPSHAEADKDQNNKGS